MYFDIENLELYKVFDQVKPYCQTNKAKDIIDDLKPSTDIVHIEHMLLEVEEAYQAIVKLSEIPLGGFRDKTDAITRASIGSILSIEELYDVANGLSVVRNVIKYKATLEGLKAKLDNLNEYFSKLNIIKTTMLKSTRSETVFFIYCSSVLLFFYNFICNLCGFISRIYFA